MARLFHPVADHPPPSIHLEGTGFHHLIHVLRLKPGDDVEVFDGRGRSFLGRVASIERGSAQIVLGPPAASQPARYVLLVQSLPKADKMEWIIQKATELGASAFAPVHSSRSVVRLRGARLEQRLQRWRTIAQQAARQCGRSDVPEIFPPEPIYARVEALSPTVRCFLLDEEEREGSLAQAFHAVRADHSPVALLIGPEGGFERGEVGALRQVGALPVSLGKAKLRTETAAIVALTILLHLDGRLG